MKFNSSNEQLLSYYCFSFDINLFTVYRSTYLQGSKDTAQYFWVLFSQVLIQHHTQVTHKLLLLTKKYLSQCLLLNTKLLSSHSLDNHYKNLHFLTILNITCTCIEETTGVQYSRFKKKSIDYFERGHKTPQPSPPKKKDTKNRCNWPNGQQRPSKVNTFSLYYLKEGNTLFC